MPLQSFLAVEDIGDTLDAVEALITKHNNFEKSLVAQEEKFKVRIIQEPIIAEATPHICQLNL